MKLTRLGYYKEMSHGDETDPSIKDYINKSIKNKSKICKYLSEGIVIAACGEVVVDAINPDNGIIGTPDDLTDGKWIWPADLVYYVNNYNLELPEDFINTMEMNNWQIPISEKDIDITEIEVV